MIRFSWKKINDKFDWNEHSALEYMFLKQGLKPPSYLTRKIPDIVKRASCLPYEQGPCFLRYPNEALLAATAPNYLYLYLELASKRNIFDWHIRGILHLPLVLAEEYQMPWIEINPMLEIENDNIYFKYEQEKQ